MDDQQSLIKNIQQQLLESQKLHSMLDDLVLPLTLVINKLIATYMGGGKLILFGNGGSAADAQHIAAEMLGHFKLNRPSWPAIALTTNTSALTAIANDFSYDEVFERQVDAWAQQNDVVIGISTSGKSANVIKGLVLAKARGAFTVAMTGNHTLDMQKHADVVLGVPSSNTPRIQEVHILLGHMLCELVERTLEAEQQTGRKQ